MSYKRSNIEVIEDAFALRSQRRASWRVSDETLCLVLADAPGSNRKLAHSALSYLRQLTAPSPDPHVEERRAERQAEFDAHQSIWG